MEKCEIARSNTRARAASVILLAAYESLQENDFSLRSIGRRSIKLGREWLRTDQKARRDLGIVLGCKIQKFLNS